MTDLNRWILQSLQAMVMIGLAVASVVVVVLVIVPQLWTAIEVQGKIGEDKEKLNEVATKLASLSELDQDSLRTKLVDILEVLPEDFEVPRIIGTIKQLGVDTSLDVREVEAVVQEAPINPAAGGNQSSVDKQRVSLTVTADIEGMVKFLEELEKVVPILKVMEVKASKNTSESLDAFLMVESYAYGEPPAANSGRDISQPVLKLEAQDDRLYEELKQRKRYELATASGVMEEGRSDPFELPGN